MLEYVIDLHACRVGHRRGDPGVVSSSVPLVYRRVVDLLPNHVGDIGSLMNGDWALHDEAVAISPCERVNIRTLQPSQLGADSVGELEAMKRRSLEGSFVVDSVLMFQRAGLLVRAQI